LHRASRYGKTEIVKLLLPHHPDPLALVEARRQNSLHLAVQYGKIETIESICRYIRDSNHLQGCSVKGESDNTSQGCSCPSSYPRLEDADFQGFTALHIGLITKSPRAVSSLLQFSKSIADRPMRWEELTPKRLLDGKPLLWRQPLHHALKKIDMVKALLDGGADMNLTDCEGQTPLMVAIHENNEEATKLLLAHGADFLTPCEVHQCNTLQDAAIQFSLSILDQVDIRDSRNDMSTDRGRVILQEAQNNRRWDIVQALIENCRRKEAVGTILDEEETLLPALRNSAEPVVDLLLANSANPNCKLHYAKDARWALSLHIAAEEDTITVAQALVRNGAGLLLENHRTRLPYEVAIYHAGIDTVGWFLKETITIIRKQTRTSKIVDTVTKVLLKSGDRACGYGSLETLELVLKIGKQEVDNFVQKSLFLHHAIRYGRIRLVKYLLDSGFEPNFLDGGNYTFCPLSSMYNQRGNKAEDYEACIKMVQEAIDSRGVHSPKTRRASRLSWKPTPAR
jgi:ankyrin repeat protein